MTYELSKETRDALFDYLCRLGDDRLILGHRLSEWAGHGPILEEDIALSNLALDLIGQAQALLKLAGAVEGNNRSEDDIVYLRETIEFRNCVLVELPKGDFAKTIMRQFLFDVFSNSLWAKLKGSSFADLAAIAAKSAKEDAYHLRHSAEWVKRLGDGTAESHERAQSALNDLWPYTAELFVADRIDAILIEQGMAPNPEDLKKPWLESVSKLLAEATLSVPSSVGFVASSGRRGMHSEHLGHLLAEMQILPRSYPGAVW